MITIRDPQAPDEEGWRRLWSGYVHFYAADVPEAVTAATWQRMLDPAAPLFGRLAVQRDAEGMAAAPERIVGFAVCVLHAGTWTLDPVCYLEDLFVDPPARGGGIGRTLIEDLVGLARAGGWSRLYWHTRASNAAARRLYDCFGAADDYVRYRLVLK